MAQPTVGSAIPEYNSSLPVGRGTFGVLVSPPQAYIP